MANPFEMGATRSVGTRPGKPPTNEIGALGNFGSAVLPWQAFSAGQFETVPELIWPTSVSTYGAMVNDAQVYALLLGTTLPIRRYKWMIDPNGADQAITDGISKDLNLPVKGEDGGLIARQRDRFSHDRHLFHALLALANGHYYFEQVGYIGDDGLWHLSKLAPRPPATISMIGVADDGGLVFIQQSITKTYGIAPEIPVDRLVAFVWDMEGGNWAGRSMLRSIYRDWLIKDRLLRINAINHERAGGIPYINAPQGAGPQQMRELNEMAMAFRVGEDAGGALPYDAKLNFAAPVGSNAVESIKMHNEEMARNFLMMFMQLGQTETGSRALGESFIDWFSLQQQGIAGWYAEIMNRYVLEDWVDWNYGPDVEQVPRLVFEASSDPLAIVGPLVQLLNAKALQADPEMENVLRSALGFSRVSPTNPPSPPLPEPSPTEPGNPPPAQAAFDPHQKRDPHTGRWVNIGGSDLPPLGEIYGKYPAQQKASHEVANALSSKGGVIKSIEPAGHRTRITLSQKVTVGGIPRDTFEISHHGDINMWNPGLQMWDSIRLHSLAQASRQTRRVSASAPSSLPLPGRPLRRQPYEQEVQAKVNYAALETDWQTARDKLVNAWQSIRKAQVKELVDVIAQTDPSDLEKLAAISIEPGQGTPVIEEVMHELLALGAAGALQEAQAQGQTTTMPSLDEAEKLLSDRAAAVDALLTRDLSQAAARKAIALAGQALSADDVANEVKTYLDGLSDAYLQEQFGGAVQAAQNAGRREVMDSHDPSQIYASELLDVNTCENCRAVDGTVYGSIAEFDADYPTGGYKDCLGGGKCRGTGIAVYGEEAP